MSAAHVDSKNVSMPWYGMAGAICTTIAAELFGIYLGGSDIQGTLSHCISSSIVCVNLGVLAYAYCKKKDNEDMAWWGKAAGIMAVCLSILIATHVFSSFCNKPLQSFIESNWKYIVDHTMIPNIFCGGIFALGALLFSLGLEKYYYDLGKHKLEGENVEREKVIRGLGLGFASGSSNPSEAS